MAGLAPWLLVLLKEHGLLLRPAFHTFCHQLPERTLVLMGHPMVVCSRCAGIYGGMALGALVPASGFITRRGRLLLLLSLGLMLVDVLAQDLGLRPPSHFARIATGLFLGWSASAYLFASIQEPEAPASSFKEG